MKKLVSIVAAAVLAVGLAGCSPTVEDEFFDYWLEITSRGLANEYHNAKDKDAYKKLVIAAGYDVCDAQESSGIGITYLISFMKKERSDIGAISMVEAAGKKLCPELWW